MRQVNRSVGRMVATIRSGLRVLHESRGLTILGWHRIGTARDGLTTRLEDFRSHLDCLQALGAHVLPLDDAVRLLSTDRLPRRAVALTFDDGYSSVGRLAWPELEQRGMPATLYVVPGFLDGQGRFPWDAHASEADAALLAAAEVLALSRQGLDIGSHTMFHRWLPASSSAELSTDLRESRRQLEELVGAPVSGLAYPTGGWDRRVRQAARAAGYAHAVTVDRGLNRGGSADVLSLRRSFAPDDARDLEILLNGGYDHLRLVDSARRRVAGGVS
jgi:peptidoglycan/xylan/chitin deacetylase (PgdA/CDA1 family)